MDFKIGYLKRKNIILKDINLSIDRKEDFYGKRNNRTF